MDVENQAERLAWIEHCLSDPDAGRLMSWDQLDAMDKERKQLRQAVEADSPHILKAVQK